MARAASVPSRFLVLAAFVLVPTVRVGATGESPAAVIEKFHAALLSVMRRADALGYGGRVAVLRPVIAATLDLPYMAKKAVGRHWKAFSPEQRTRIVTTFSKLTVATYAARFDGYGGERFETLGREPGAYGTVLVRSRLIKSDGDDVDLTYRLHRASDGWRIVDIFLKGTVSELAMRRSEYVAVIRRKGFGALIAALNRKIRAYAAGEPAR
ncbi:MAG: ABC transporter substrate-binding protein [Candidatus Binatia bacterium]